MAGTLGEWVEAAKKKIADEEAEKKKLLDDAKAYRAAADKMQGYANWHDPNAINAPRALRERAEENERKANEVEDQLAGKRIILGLLTSASAELEAAKERADSEVADEKKKLAELEREGERLIKGAEAIMKADPNGLKSSESAAKLIEGLQKLRAADVERRRLAGKQEVMAARG